MHPSHKLTEGRRLSCKEAGERVPREEIDNQWHTTIRGNIRRPIMGVNGQHLLRNRRLTADKMCLLSELTAYSVFIRVWEGKR